MLATILQRLPMNCTPFLLRDMLVVCRFTYTIPFTHSIGFGTEHYSDCSCLFAKKQLILLSLECNIAICRSAYSHYQNSKWKFSIRNCEINSERKKSCIYFFNSSNIENGKKTIFISEYETRHGTIFVCCIIFKSNHTFMFRCERRRKNRNAEQRRIIYMKLHIFLIKFTEKS